MSDRDFSVSIHLDEPAQTLCSPIGNTAEPPIIPPSIGLSGLVVFTGEMRAQVPTGLAPFLRASLENAWRRFRQGAALPCADHLSETSVAAD